MKSILFSFILFSLSIGCNNQAPDLKASELASDETTVILTSVQLKNAGIVTDTLAGKAISTLLKLNGKIDVPPQNLVSISVPLGGYLKKTNLLPGMHVNKGQVIAIIEDQQYIQLQQDYLTAKARIKYLEAEFNRQRELNKNQASSDKVYQQAESEFSTQQIIISSLSQKLQLVGISIDRLSENNISRSINIYSPIDGFVSAVNVNIGKYVSPTEVLFELINPADIHLNLRVFEKDIPSLFIGQKLSAYTNNNPQKKHEADILLIGKNIVAEGYTEVHCHFEDYDKALIPGTYMNAELLVTKHSAFVIPEEAIVRFENKHYVFQKIDSTRFSMILIQIGETNEGFTEIKNGSEIATKQIVRKGAYTLLMSLKNSGEEE
ncbi:MAG: efflux RND transporter periplasmic adaptor subunit [Ferruginibacter sp.]